MTSFEKFELKSPDGIGIGYEFKIKGDLVYGTEVSVYQKIKNTIENIQSLATSEIIALNILDLNRWDSLGVSQVLSPIIKVNEKLLEKAKNPISIVGKKDTDNYKAARDKFPDINDTDKLPWYETTEELIQKIYE